MSLEDDVEEEKYYWSDDSALWEIEHSGSSEKTDSAFAHLEGSINGGEIDTVRSLAMKLLSCCEVLRDTGRF